MLRCRIGSNLYSSRRPVSEGDAKAHRSPCADPGAFQAVASEFPTVASSADQPICLPSTPEARVRVADDGPPTPRHGPVASRSVHSLSLHESRKEVVCTILHRRLPSSGIALMKVFDHCSVTKVEAVAVKRAERSLNDLLYRRLGCPAGGVLAER